MHYYLEPWDHQKNALTMQEPLTEFAFFMDMGCLVGSSKISAHRAGRGFKITIKELYEKFNGVAGRWDLSLETCVRSYKEDEGHVGLNPIVAVIDSGKKPVFRLKLANRQSITGTHDHKIYTDQGFKELCSLSKGDLVAVDTLTKHKKTGSGFVPIKPRYTLLQVGLFHPHSQHATHHDGRAIRRVEKHRLVFEAALNGMELKDFQQATHSKNKLKFVDPKRFHIHHKDHDPKNNGLDNLEKLGAKEHLQQHTKGYSNFKHGELSFVPVADITSMGEKQTYDICCTQPYDNYVANGIVVHNTGKTMVTVNALRQKYYKHKRVLRTLILCPVAVCNGWLKEFKAHAPANVSERVYLLSGPGKERVQTIKKAIEKHAGNCIFVMNYEGLSIKAVLAELVKWKPEALVGDESQRIKNYKAKRTEVCWDLADLAAYKYILSGTPILNSPLDIFSQYRFLDGGRTFGRNFYSFRASYFTDKNAGMPSAKHFPNWQPLPGTSELFHKKIYTKAIRVMKDACLDLPPFINQVVEAPLGREQERAYNEMRDHFLAYLEDDACTADLAITKSLRLQQILSGHAKLEESGEIFRFDQVPRLDVLRDIVEGIPAESKFVVWACFRENYSDIQKVVEKLGIKCVRLVGGMAKGARDSALHKFQHDPEVRGMVANPASAGVGVDGMQVANYAVYYSRNFNLEHDLQSNDRIYRGGSEVHKKITRIDIVAPGTLDEAIRESLKNKHTSAEAILAWREKLCL